MAKILYHAVPGDWRKEQKYSFLEKTASVAGVKWQKLQPDKTITGSTWDSARNLTTLCHWEIATRFLVVAHLLFSEVSVVVWKRRETIGSMDLRRASC